MASVPKVNIKIPQGTTYVHDFNYVDTAGTAISLSGYTARLQFRDEVESVAFFHEATTENGGLSVNEVGGVITLTITHVDTAAFTVLKGVYDLEIISPGTAVTRIVKGSVTIDPEVTR